METMTGERAAQGSEALGDVIMIMKSLVTKTAWSDVLWEKDLLLSSLKLLKKSKGSKCHL